jgi:hypothetical protein
MDNLIRIDMVLYILLPLFFLGLSGIRSADGGACCLAALVRDQETPAAVVWEMLKECGW